jgi:hypothetical protein
MWETAKRLVDEAIKTRMEMKAENHRHDFSRFVDEPQSLSLQRRIEVVSIRQIHVILEGKREE